MLNITGHSVKQQHVNTHLLEWPELNSVGEDVEELEFSYTAGENSTTTDLPLLTMVLCPDKPTAKLKNIKLKIYFNILNLLNIIA